MEAYFHKDPRIAEWIEQINETVFNVCLLTGKDSEKEFQKGSQTVTKLTSLLQGISTFPTEYLEDGLKQLLEQQIPDARVIYNYPAFQDTMDRMLHEGMLNAINSQNEKVPDTSISISEKTSEHMRALNRNSESTEHTSPEEFLTELAISALASFDITSPEFKELEVEDKTINIKAYGILRTSQVPEQATSLRHSLSKIFPNSSVYWNINLMGQTFLAQVENILICLLDSEHPILLEDFAKEGWKVFMCSSEDLTFPRRLERGIRQIQRSGRKSQIV